MQQVSFHPLADIFPLLHSDGDSFAALVDSISKNGLIDPITLHEGMIVDGRNRYRACLKAGIEPRFVQMEWTGLVADFVWNRHQRREESQFERRLSAGRYAVAREGESEQRRVANLRNAPSTVSIDTVEEAGRSRELAAERFGVSEATVARAVKVLKEGAPELIAAVEGGEVAVSAGADIATLPREDQAVIVEAGPDVVVEAAKRIRTKTPAHPSKPRPGETARAWTKRIAAEIAAKKPAPAAEAVADDADDPHVKSVALLREALLAFAEEVAADPDSVPADSYEAGVRQAASSPYIDGDTFICIVAQLDRTKKNMEASAKRDARDREASAKREAREARLS